MDWLSVIESKQPLGLYYYTHGTNCFKKVVNIITVTGVKMLDKFKKLIKEINTFIMFDHKSFNFYFN